jgi:hypothetical protein
MPSFAGAIEQEAHSGEDVEMDDGAKKQRLITGYSELSYKRDHMRV